MQVGTGKSILNGIAIGKLKLYKKKNTTISVAEVADTAAEIERFEDARAKAIDQQTALYEKALAEAGPQTVYIPGYEFHKNTPFDYLPEWQFSSSLYKMTDHSCNMKIKSRTGNSGNKVESKIKNTYNLISDML